MTELPESMIVLGAGYIAVEMAQIMTALGVKTTLICRNEMLTGVDQELIPHLLHSMERLGLDARRKTPFDSVEKTEAGKLKVNLRDGGSLEADKVLAALGRPPNFEPLLLDNAGVTVERNAIKVDEY